MIKFLKLSIALSASLLVGCQQQSCDCEMQKQKIQLLEQKLATGNLSGNIAERMVKQQQQLIQVTRELVVVKVERDKLKQELRALRKIKTKN